MKFFKSEPEPKRFETDSHTADGKRGDEFMASLLSDVFRADGNVRGSGEEIPWHTVAHYLVNLERRVCELEDALAKDKG